ncbi:MAG: tRNA (N6-isopentenyl adenosine(37)-C2)-methylthiotransferase MiaB [Deltaproteobacteria bacterium]|nr:tRNA (N6-isopentenyl adenosine(37)-C2)-methylthiotransferase MiaB [Deltaproteobacteria bacterium]
MTGKLVFLETFGCQMNDNDSLRMLSILKDLGYSRTDAPERADLIIINTCSVRGKAEHKVYSTIGRFRPLKREKPSLIIGVSGCVAQQEGERLLKRSPYLDIVFGPQNIHRLKEILSAASIGKERVVATAQSLTIDDSEYGRITPASGEKASVSIMRGCDNFCSYCIVPYTRGREVSRSSAGIIREVAALASSGVREVTLLGQNVNSYGAGGKADATFPELLRMAAGVEGIERVRFITSHPRDISEELIYLFGEEPKLCRHIHLPVQSGSDAILERMGRGYTKKEYMSKVSLFKKLYPDISVTTDMIVGFPGETEGDFKDTMDLINEVRFDNVFSFMYSPRPGTLAAGFAGQAALDVKSERLHVLQETQRGITEERNRALVGRRAEVLVEGESKARPEELSGRTSCNRIVNFQAPKALTGTLADVIITDAFPNSLRGVYQDSPSFTA